MSPRRQVRAGWRRSLAALAALAATMAGGSAAPPASAMEALTAGELSEQRGGFLVADQLVFDFGVVASTYENGALSLRTTVTWTNEGPQTLRFVGPGVVPADSRGLPAAAFLTPGGATLVQDVAGGRILSLVLNPASNLDLRQETVVTVDLPGFGAVQADMLRQLSGLRITGDLAAGSVAAVRF